VRANGTRSGEVSLFTDMTADVAGLTQALRSESVVTGPLTLASRRGDRGRRRPRRLLAVSDLHVAYPDSHARSWRR
jgi:hypothetical protein